MRRLPRPRLASLVQVEHPQELSVYLLFAHRRRGYSSKSTTCRADGVGVNRSIAKAAAGRARSCSRSCSAGTRTDASSSASGCVDRPSAQSNNIY